METPAPDIPKLVITEKKPRKKRETKKKKVQTFTIEKGPVVLSFE
jgi:hypothetical protein